VRHGAPLEEWGEPLFTFMRAQFSRCFDLERHIQFGVHAVKGTGGTRMRDQPQDDSEQMARDA
jgi:hypothetical protein